MCFGLASVANSLAASQSRGEGREWEELSTIAPPPNPESLALSRASLLFFSFVGLIVLLIGAFAAYLGANGVAFLLHGERKTAPFVMIDLVDYPDAAREARDREQFAVPALAMVRTLGGDRLWEGRLDGVLRGRSRDRWTGLSLVRYPSRAAYVDLVTSKEYRALKRARADNPTRNAMLVAVARRPLEPGGSAFVARFVTGDKPDWLERYEAQWRAEDERLLARFGGRIVWQAQVTPLVADERDSFDELWLYAFDATPRRAQWAENVERLTTSSLEQPLFKRDVMLFLHHDDDAAPAAPPPADTAPEPAPTETPTPSTETVAEEEPHGRVLVELAQVRHRARADLVDQREVVAR